MNAGRPSATGSRGALVLITGARPGPVPPPLIDGYPLRQRVLAQLLGVRLVMSPPTGTPDTERGRRVDRSRSAPNPEKASTKTDSGIPPVPPAAERRRRPYAASEATRLMCAGTYVDPAYRKQVIKELIGDPNQDVAQAVGYDNVVVLGYALAARRLRRIHLGFRLIGLLVALDVFTSDPLLGLFLGFWLLWASGVALRVAGLRALTSRLKEPFDGSFPPSARLRPSLAARISEGQEPRRVITYGGYNPFIGSGRAGRSWSMTQLLSDVTGPRSLSEVAALGMPDDHGVIPFTSSEIMHFVAERMAEELNESRYGEFAEPAVVELQRYARAANDFPHEYLCVRIGTADQELIVSAFIGFDLRGDALHTEFHTYVLLPVNDAFRIVDGLPSRVDARLLRRIFWHVFADLPTEFNRGLRRVFRRVPVWWAPWLRRRRRAEATSNGSDPRGLARYAAPVSRGPVVSIRELAAGGDYSSLFQEADAEKFRELVERKALRLIRGFLVEHGVDPAEHDEFQAGILHHNIARSGDADPFHSPAQAAAPRPGASRTTPTTSG